MADGEHPDLVTDPDLAAWLAVPPDYLERIARLCAERGFQACTHAIGDRAVALGLAVIERAVKPVVTHRHAEQALARGQAVVVLPARILADGGEPVPGLTPPECESEGGDRYLGTWALLFRQP